MVGSAQKNTRATSIDRTGELRLPDNYLFTIELETNSHPHDNNIHQDLLATSLLDMVTNDYKGTSTPVEIYTKLSEIHKPTADHSLQMCLIFARFPIFEKVLGPEKTIKIMISALLHDIGKTAMLDLIDFPGQLGIQAREILGLHPFLSARIVEMYADEYVTDESLEIIDDHHCSHEQLTNENNTQPSSDMLWLLQFMDTFHALFDTSRTYKRRWVSSITGIPNTSPSLLNIACDLESIMRSENNMNSINFCGVGIPEQFREMLLTFAVEIQDLIYTKDNGIIMNNIGQHRKLNEYLVKNGLGEKILLRTQEMSKEMREQEVIAALSELIQFPVFKRLQNRRIA